MPVDDPFGYARDDIDIAVSRLESAARAADRAKDVLRSTDKSAGTQAHSILRAASQDARSGHTRIGSAIKRVMAQAFKLRKGADMTKLDRVRSKVKPRKVALRINFTGLSQAAATMKTTAADARALSKVATQATAALRAAFAASAGWDKDNRRPISLEGEINGDMKKALAALRHAARLTSMLHSQVIEARASFQVVQRQWEE